MIGVGIALVVVGLALLAGASFFAFDPADRASGLVSALAGVSAVFGNRYWLRRQRLLRLWFGALTGFLGIAFVVGGIVTAAK